ncbi:MAG: adenosylcobinamide-phosphate synthase CbiB [Deltaproteobacteria bacterium]
MPDFLELTPFAPVVLVFAYLADMIFGDPEGLPHPVRWIGRAIALLEAVLRRSASTPSGERAAGVVLVVMVAGGVWAVSAALLYFAYIYSMPVFYALSSYIVWTSLCAGSLRKEASLVVRAFEEKGLVEARSRLSRIVGRDTSDLTPDGVMRGAVETVAENSSDGIVAPLFYLAIGGPALMIAYKAVNTLDSMVGYKNERYLNFGWASARFDDIANFIPARISGVLIALSAFFLGYNSLGSLRVMVKDGRNHPSPNSGISEAAMAGALGVKLGGPSYYGGKYCAKPYIGSEGASADASSVKASIRVMSATALLMVLIVFVTRLVFFNA